MEKFQGDLQELKNHVAELGRHGEWTGSGDKWVFRCEDGAILNWWPSTGTLQCQGPSDARTKLQEEMSGSLSGDASNSEVSPSNPNPDTIPADACPEGKQVFVVHGHDETALEQLELVLHRLGLDPFVLKNTSGQGLTLIEALERKINSSMTGNRFGIVLLTPDDMGYKQGDEQQVEPRARQNVVMEMGMLIAAFGRSNVAILKKGHVEVPSDASGIIYLSFNNHVKEIASKLCERLRIAGFEISADAITRASS